MITFYQQAHENKNTFCVVQHKDTATHYSENGGPTKPIEQLVTNVPPDNLILPLPVMNFDDSKKVAKSGDEKKLPLPAMTF